MMTISWPYHIISAHAYLSCERLAQMSDGDVLTERRRLDALKLPKLQLSVNKLNKLYVLEL